MMELEMLRAIQSIANPFFDFFFELITVAGEQIVLILLFCAVYWVFDKNLGHTMGLTIITSLFVNNSLKELFDMPRPIGEEGIRSLRTETATGKSFPSGHTQGAAAAYGSFALGIGRTWLYWVVGILITLIGLSRLYLGVHYPKDVAAGLALGILCAVLCRWLTKCIQNLAILLAGVNGLMILLMLFLPSEDGIKAAGLALGMLVGYLIEQKKIRFTTDNLPAKKKIKRYVIGMIVVLACYGLPKLLIPFDMGIVWYLRYAFVSFSITVLAPLTFRKFDC